MANETITHLFVSTRLHTLNHCTTNREGFAGRSSHTASNSDGPNCVPQAQGTVITTISNAKQYCAVSVIVGNWGSFFLLESKQIS